MSIARRALLAAAALPAAALATEHTPVLEIAGGIAPPSPRSVSLSELEAFGPSALVTHTPWTTGPQHFAGVTMERLLSVLDARGATLRAIALNDYAVSMPVAEAVADEAFLATRIGGVPMPVRTRGPLWIVFPWSARPQLENAVTRQRSIWQIRRIEIA
jgi:hypothetical protein